MFVDYPLGHTAGPPGDAVAQRTIIVAALDLLETATEPGAIVDVGLSWPGGSGWKREEDSADSRKPRVGEPQYQCDADRVAAEAEHSAGRCRSCIGIDI